MENVDKIAIIGGGGIGSELCRILYKLLQHGQLGDVAFTLYDDDIVENKNLKHQNFMREDVGIPKALLLTGRYSHNSKIQCVLTRFTKEHLDDYDMYIICADNAKVRKLVFDYVNSPDGCHKSFIDLRCSGDFYSVYTHKCGLPELIDSLGEDAESEQGYSCQRVVDVTAGKVQLGNFAVAPVGAQFLLNMLRGDALPKQVFRRVF